MRPSSARVNLLGVPQPMEATGNPSPGNVIVELSVLEGQRPEEQRLLNGADQRVSSSAEQPGRIQVQTEDPWKRCNRILCWRCKLWMAIVSIFLVFILVIIMSLILMRDTYIDEDDYEMPELSSNKTFLVTLKIPEECAGEKELQHLLSARLTDVYSSSPSLSRYFTSVQIEENASDDNSTVTYHLLFGVPEDDNFMKYMMSEELILGVLKQNFHDQNIPGCETLGLDPASLSLYE